MNYTVFHCDDGENCASGVCESNFDSSHFSMIDKQKCRYGYVERKKEKNEKIEEVECVPAENGKSDLKCHFNGKLEITKEADLARLIDCTEIKAVGKGLSIYVVRTIISEQLWVIQ